MDGSPNPMKKPQKAIIALTVIGAIMGSVLIGLKNSVSPKLLSSVASETRSPDQTDGHGESTRAPGGETGKSLLSLASEAIRKKSDSPTSSHPVEKAVANGSILDSRLEKAKEENRWMRVRLVRTGVQPRLVRVVELWQIDPATSQATSVSREMFLADQLIVKAVPGVNERILQNRLQSAGMVVDAMITDRTYTVRLAKADLDAVPEALQFLSAHPGIAEAAEPDGVGFGSGTPNDSQFSSQWGLHNTGQSGGAVDADVDGPEFWDIMESAPGIVIAVLDSGLNFTHPDLQNIAWINPGEIANDGIDNDANGRIDDVNGWDFVNSDKNPTDDHGHGSNVTGIIAANRNNGQGIAGMLGGVRILVCKILNSNNSGLTSDLIAATTYARQRGVPVMNLSLQNYPHSSALNTEFTACQTAGIVLCICAGNQGVNNDTSPNYPSSYTQSNIISVGNHDRTDLRWSGSFNPSNFGLVSVDLFAPGRNILSPILGTSYSNYTGTSQATPFVTAVCGAIKHANPEWKAAQIKNSILSSVVTKSSYSGVCVTGGRLNAVSAVSHAFRQLPLQDTDSDRFSNLFEYLAGSRMDEKSSRPSVFHNTDGGLLRIGVPRVLRPDAHFRIETSMDLISWETTGITDFSSPETLLGGIPIAGEGAGFLRIGAIPVPQVPP
jgi:subtilisin family serine protease